MRQSNCSDDQVVKVEDLRVSYREGEALRRVTLDVPSEKITGIVGESGCGKSTLARSIIRLLPVGGRIVGGSIYFRDVDLLKLNEKKMRRLRGAEISMVFQDPSSSLNPLYRCGDLISETLECHGDITREEGKKRAVEILSELLIGDPERVLESYPFELSGGMKQRVMIAIAVCTEPSLLIADEPTSNLDVTVQAQILKIFHNLNRNLGTSIIFISHDLAVVSQISDFVAVAYAGEIVEFGDQKTVLLTPQHFYTKALIKTVPKIGKAKLIPNPIRGRLPGLGTTPQGCAFHPRCPNATSECRMNSPTLRKISPTHFVKCFI